MPYFPAHEDRAYRCQGCGRWFIPGNRSCLVAHPPGTCCHEYETPLNVRPRASSPGPSPYDLSVGQKGFRR